VTPPAPARFSITNGRPRSSAICAVTNRATRSTVPPAGNGSSRRIGLSGYCALAGVAVARAKPSAAVNSGGQRRADFNAERIVSQSLDEEDFSFQLKYSLRAVSPNILRRAA